jgi:hypothetical protein
MSVPKPPQPSTVSGTPVPGTATAESIAAQKRYQEMMAKHYRGVANIQRWLQENGTKKANRARWYKNVKYMQQKDPQLLKYLREKFPEQVAEAEAAIAKDAAKAAAKAKPKVSWRFRWPKIGGFKASFKAGVSGAFSSSNLAALAAEIVLTLADREAAKDAIRKIQTKYLREGFARGFAAGLMGWEDEEVQLQLKNRVRVEDLQAMHDPAGILTRSQMFQLADAHDSYAVDVGFEYSSQRPNDWKLSMLKKGFAVLSERGVTKWQRSEDPGVLFEYEFINDLAWALRSTADTLVVIRFH